MSDPTMEEGKPPAQRPTALLTVVCGDCGGSFHTAKVTTDLHCGCGSDNLDLDMRVEADQHTAVGVTPKDKGRPRIDIINDVVNGGPFAADGKLHHIDGAALDGMTANLLKQVHSALSPENKAKFDRLPIDKLVSLGWKHTKGLTHGSRTAADEAVRKASPQAWDRVRSSISQGESRDLAEDIASVAGGDPELIAHALVGYDWRSRKQGSRTAAVTGGPGYYILSKDVAIAGPYESTSAAHDDLPTQRGDTVMWLTDPSKVRGLSDMESFPNPSGWTGGGDQPTGAFSGGSGKPSAYGIGTYSGKLQEIAVGLMRTSKLDRPEAERIARETLERYPKMVRSAPELEVSRY